MSEKIERQIQEQAEVWSGVPLPNKSGEETARGFAQVIKGFEKLRGQLVFEDEPSSFEAALQETKERTP